MPAMSPDVLLACANVLGESPLWCTRRQRLFWVDIRAPALFACDADGANVTTTMMPEAIGSFAFRRDDTLVAAMKSGLYDFDPASGRHVLIAAPDAALPDHRFNEGKCDAHGRFWAGTMNDVLREPTGSLFRLDRDRSCGRILTGIAVPNSLAWSPDGTVMYFADTETQTILAYQFDADAGVPRNPRLFADLRSGRGRPDGSTIDAQGCLWNAEVVTGRIARYAPDGRLLGAWKLPVSRVTSLTFGGADLRTIYATTSSYKLTPAQLAQEPHAGALFAMRAPVEGLPAATFGA
jgi:sugar lactone lactonase YvrE